MKCSITSVLRELLRRNMSSNHYLNLQEQKQQEEIEKILKIGNTVELTIACQRTSRPLQRLRFTNKGFSVGSVTTVSRSQEQHGTSYNIQFSSGPQEELDLNANSAYCIASYTKIIINFLVYIVLRMARDIDLATDACEAFKRYRHKHPDEDIQNLQLHLDTHPTIRDILTHEKSFPPVNKQLFAPDCSCIVTAAEILRVANAKATAAASSKGNTDKDKRQIRYSNVNHIFAAVIIECLTGMHLQQAMSEFVFKPLKMENSYFGWRGAQPTHYQISSDNILHQVRGRLALNDLAECAPLGLLSTVGDLEKFVHQLFLALSGGNNQLISQEDAVDFFNVNKSLAGFVAHFSSNPVDMKGVVSESPNTYLCQSTHRFQSYKDWKHQQPQEYPPRIENEVRMYHKSGYCDGYGCAVFLLPRISSYLIVLAKGTGPLDVVHYVSWLLLQKLLQVSHPVNVYREAIKAYTLCSETLVELEDKHFFRESRGVNSAIIPAYLSGVYEDTTDQQQLTINNDTIFFGTEPKISSSMRIILVKATTARIQLDGPVMSIEVWSTWADMDFIIQRHGAQVSLSLKLRNGDEHLYQKICDGI